MLTSGLSELDELKVSFVRQPYPLPGDLRPAWRVALVLFLISSCHGSSATPQQLHILDWACRMRDAGEELLQALRGEGADGESLLRIDPALTRAVAWAAALGLITYTSAGRIRATDRGTQLAGAIEQQGDSLMAEREYLAQLPRKLSQADVGRIVGEGGHR